MGLSVTVRDLRFDFTNSCNCCGEDDPLVYVNTRGGVEKFDPRKAQDERGALARSLEHLTAILDARSESHKSDPNVLRRSLSGSIAEFSDEKAQHMSYSTLKKIKRFMDNPGSLWASD